MQAFTIMEKLGVNNLLNKWLILKIKNKTYF